MILVTGSTGLIGGHVTAKLLGKGHDIKVLVRADSHISSLKETMGHDAIHAEQLFNNIMICHGDLLDYDSIMNAMDGVDEVYHCAGYISFNPADKNRLYDINANGTRNMVNAALESGVSKFGYVSSVAALNSEESEEISEADFIHDAGFTSHYSSSKFYGELEVWRGIAEGLRAVVINPSIVLGPGKRGTGSAGLFHAVRKGLKFYTDGITGFVDVHDVSEIMIQLMEQEKFNERFIVSSENYAYRDLFEQIAAYLDVSAPKFPASQSLLNIAWRLARIGSFFTGRPPSITKETAASANKQSHYSNSKVTETLNHKFLSVKDSLYNNCQLFLKEI